MWTMHPLPDFLGIGGQRCGSTWLHAMMRQSRQVWLPPVKELHYFDGIQQPMQIGRRASGTLLLPIHVRRYVNFIRKPALEYVRDSLHFGADVEFFARFAIPSTSLSWYGGLFAGARRRGLPCGDITPAYGVLPDADVHRIVSLQPNLKVLFLVRDPVARAWSHAMKDLARAAKRRAADIPRQELESFFERSDFLKRCAYSEIYRRWSEALPPGRVFVDRYEAVGEEPDQLLRRVFSFLDLDPSEVTQITGVTKRVNATHESRQVPEPFASMLAERLAPERAWMREHLRLDH